MSTYNHEYSTSLASIISNAVWLGGAYDEHDYQRTVNKPKLHKSLVDEYGKDLGCVLFHVACNEYKNLEEVAFSSEAVEGED